ncbi:hypothetical protein PINS_up008672 [Pythium insidiosum]|nr:hypothetical protein PINS_up008672 [Pythium insidiosum]
MTRSHKMLLCWALAVVHLASHMGNAYTKLYSYKYDIKPVTPPTGVTPRTSRDLLKIKRFRKAVEAIKQHGDLQVSLNYVFPNGVIRADAGEANLAPRNPITYFWAAKNRDGEPHRIGWGRLLELALDAVEKLLDPKDQNTKLLEGMEQLLCTLNCRCKSVSVRLQDVLTPSAFDYAAKIRCACVLPPTSAPPNQPRTAVSGHDTRELADSSDVDEFCDQLVLFMLEVDSVNGNFDDFGLKTDDLGMCLWCINQLNGTSSTNSETDSGRSTTDKTSLSASTHAPASSAPASVDQVVITAVLLLVAMSVVALA